MEPIIADRTYAVCRSLIQVNVDKALLGEEARNRLIELYNSLTTENAEEVYTTVVGLLKRASTVKEAQGFAAFIGCTGVLLTVLGCGEIIAGCIGNLTVDAPELRKRACWSICMGMGFVTVALILDQ